MRHRIVQWGGVCLGVALAGCGERFETPTTYDVKGTVLLSDGKPLGFGRIYFGPQGDPPVIAQGEIGPDGSFALTTNATPGAVPGVYSVWIDPTPREPSAVPTSKRPSILPKYTQQDSTDLVVTVKPEPNRLEPLRLR